VISRFTLQIIACTGILLVSLTSSEAQQNPIPTPRNPSTDNTQERTAPRNLPELLDSQRIQRQRREHLAMLKRAEDALELAEELETSVGENGAITLRDRRKLEDLEKLVTRIRRDMGGRADSSLDEMDEEEIEKARSPIKESVTFLRESIGSLVEELQRTSRFTVSAMAIQSSNSIIRFARFLRLRR
jgi:hypothetical protein